MTPTTPSAALAAQLTPWHAALRALGSPNKFRDRFVSTYSHAPPYTLWIIDDYLCAEKRSSTGTVARVRQLEAVVLLDLIAQVDTEAWKATVLELWPTHETREWIEDHVFMAAPAPATFRVGVWLRDMIGAKRVAKLTRLCTVTDRDTVSPAFKDVYLSMMDRLGHEHVSVTAAVPVTVRVDFDLMDHAPHKLPKILSSVLKCVRQCRANAASEKAHNKAIIQIEEVQVEELDRMVFDEDALATWTEFTDFGVRVNKFPDLEAPSDQELWKRVVESARSLLNVPGCVGVGETMAPAVEMLMLSNKHAPQYFPGLVAAAQVSPTLRTAEIEILLDDDDDFDDFSDDDDIDMEREGLNGLRTYWKWIAYGLFSRHADHQITTLRMDLSDIRQDHVDAMAGIMAASDPLAHFYDVAEKQAPLRHVTASRLHLIDPETESHTYAYNPDGSQDLLHVEKHQSVLTTKQPITMRVIYPPKNDDDPYWTVMIPGHGDGWVHKDEMTDLTETALPTDDDWRAATRSFEYVDIVAMNDESMGPTVRLLELIGRDTTSVNMNTFEGEADLDEWTRHVLVACPRLNQLVIGLSTPSSLKLFVDAADAGECRLARLVIGWVKCDGHELFFQSLCAAQHPLTRHLHHLDLLFVIDDKRDVSPVVTSVLEMLQRNRRVQTVSIGFRLGARLAHMKPSIEASFAVAIKETVSIRTGPLALTSKLALLSAVRHHADDDHRPLTNRTLTGSAFGRLDTSVLSTVFEFAAESRTRRVKIGYVTMF